MPIQLQKRRIVTESPSPAKAGRAAAERAGPATVKHPVQQAEFVLSVANDEQLPPPGPPEIAFAGRSNAGKSSAINALANRSRLAFTSKTPGRTQQINFFRLRGGALLADLPGYGYAAVPRQLKDHWQQFLARYLATRQSLVGLVLVVDARHGLADLDRALLSGYLTSSRPVLLLATKMDKFAASAQREAARASSATSRLRFRSPSRRSRSSRFRPRDASASRLRSVARRMARRVGDSTRKIRIPTRTQRRGPASKGNGARPEIPSVGLVTTEGARSGREAGDVAVWQSRPWVLTGVPTWASISQEVSRRRMRRMRRDDFSRRLVREHRLTADDLIYPVFVLDGAKREEPVASMPGVSRKSVDLLFATPSVARSSRFPRSRSFRCIRKRAEDADGAQAWYPEGFVPRAVRALKDRFPELGIITDVALDPYTSHGQDGLIDAPATS